MKLQEEQSKYKVIRNKEDKSRYPWKQKYNRRNYKVESCFFESINRIDMSLGRLIERERERERSPILYQQWNMVNQNRCRDIKCCQGNIMNNFMPLNLTTQIKWVNYLKFKNNKKWYKIKQNLKTHIPLK